MGDFSKKSDMIGWLEKFKNNVTCEEREWGLKKLDFTEEYEQWS